MPSAYSYKRQELVEKSGNVRGTEGPGVCDKTFEFSLEGVEISGNSGEVVSNSRNVDGTRRGDLVICEENKLSSNINSESRSR